MTFGQSAVSLPVSWPGFDLFEHWDGTQRMDGDDYRGTPYG